MDKNQEIILKNTSEVPIVAISQGDVNSIGYEVILKTFADSRLLEFCTPVVYGSTKLVSYYRKTIDLQNFNVNGGKSIERIIPKKFNVVNLTDEEIPVDLGQITEVSGKYSLLSLERATEDILKNKADILVTAPVSKKAINLVDNTFIGHTEYLEKKFNAQETLMIMCSSIMKIAIITTHTPLSQVSQKLSVDLLLRKIKLLEQTLKQDFDIDKPKIAVLGLNPHAGDEGIIGIEEQEIIIPAIQKLNYEGVLAYGPFSSDAFFANGIFKNFDAILAMYHDQAMIPFKLLCFDEGVNFTAGLPIVRTSPAHGTAFDIAGKNLANPRPFTNAILTALDIYKNRKKYFEQRANPLNTNITEN